MGSVRTARQRRARRRERGNAGSAATANASAYIKRQIPTYELLSEEGLDAIERHADRILKEIGIEIRGDDEAHRLFREAGATVQGDRIRFDEGLAASLCSTAPAQFTQHARNPARSVVIGGDCTVFSPMYGAPFVRDLEKGRRYATLEDFENLVKLAYLCPWLHHSGGTICEPVDVAVNKRHLDMVYAHARWSDKAFMGSVTLPERAADSIALCRLLFGESFVAENCVILANINVNSPLVYDGTVTQVMRTYASAGQAVVVVPFVLGGAMGPVTVAGSIAQAHAEALVGVALTQLVRPGVPVIYGNFFTTVTLRSGAPTFGMPESALAYIAVGQLARRNRLPFRCGGALTASKVADAQAAQESGDSLMPVILGGANFILHAAGWLEGALVMGYEKFVLDMDHLGMMHRFLEGIQLDDNGFAMDAFHEVEPGTHFLGCQHTLTNYRTAFFEPELTDNLTSEQWEEAGSTTAETRAYARWKEMLANYEAPAIDEAVDEAMREFIAKKKAAMEDRWY